MTYWVAFDRRRRNDRRFAGTTSRGNIMGMTKETLANLIANVRSIPYVNTNCSFGQGYCLRGIEIQLGRTI